MTEPKSPRTDYLASEGAPIPESLTEYADRLLLSTGLHAEDALLIASGRLEPAEELDDLARALRAGWESTGD